MFAHELERLIEIEVERMKDNLALGFLEDFNEYRFVAGKVAGLRTAIDLMAEASAICDGKPREN